MYQQDQTNATFFLIAIIVATAISLVVIFFIIKSAVKSAVKGEFERTNGLLEWYLAKQYPDVKNIGAKAERYGDLSREYQKNYTMLQTGIRNEDRYNKIKDSISKEMADYLN